MIVQHMRSQISKRSTWGTHSQNADITTALVLSSIMTVISIFLLGTAARWRRPRIITHLRGICSDCMMTALRSEERRVGKECGAGWGREAVKPKTAARSWADLR